MNATQNVHLEQRATSNSGPRGRRQDRLLLAAALIGLAALGSAEPLRAAKITPPAVPDTIAIEAGHEPFLIAHAVGTQNFLCVPNEFSEGLSWTFTGPQATLFDDKLRQIGTHFLSHNADVPGSHNATWQLGSDSSAVWAVTYGVSIDPQWVEPGAIPWFSLKVIGREDGPTGGTDLSGTTWIQRIHTVGGARPDASECTSAGKWRMVPYAAQYVFYRAQ